jgi:hypothetical protein
MAKDNNNPFSISPNFTSQLVFGLFLTLILIMIGWSPAWSVFLGIASGFTLTLLGEASKNTSQPQTLGTSEGVDAGLKYWLFFLAGFVLMKYAAPFSVLLGCFAGLAGGLIIAFWESKETTQTELSNELSEETDDVEMLPKVSTIKRRRMAVRRSRRPRGQINLKFWEK